MKSHDDCKSYPVCMINNKNYPARRCNATLEEAEKKKKNRLTVSTSVRSTYQDNRIKTKKNTWSHRKKNPHPHTALSE